MVDDNPRKRGRPPKTPRTSGDFTGPVDSLPTPASQASPRLIQTPQAQTHGVPAITTPTQTSPARATPKATIKALPTVRDHTSDQLGAEGDEYVPREVDEAGDTKVDVLGYPQGGREYKIRTFTLPGRGEKLFMLATECARQLQYRDSYLLFNKNRSLFKIIANAKEKEELVNREILPYSYRSRQIAIVTARSMFRQFGSRVVKDGRRVRDDYWEAKAIKQGFTEDDAAGEKRPGATRAREAAAMEQLHARQPTAYGDVVYSNGPGYGTNQPPPLPPGIASTMAAMPSFDAYDPKFRDVPRPRQELAGGPYIDQTRTTTEVELSNQAGHATEYSKSINQQNRFRHQILDEYWQRPHEQPVSTPPTQPAEPAVATVAQQYSSPRFPQPDLPATQTNILNQPQPTPPAMNPPSFPHQQSSMQSPIRQSSIQQTFPREASAQFTPSHPQFPRSSSSLSISQSASQQQPLPYGAGNFSPHAMNAPQSQQAWGGPPPQPHQSPGMHRMATPQFSPNLPQGQIPSPLPGGHPSQSPHPQQMQPPQMPMMQQGGGQQLYGPGAGLQAMNAAGYGMMGQRGMYGMPGHQNQYMQPGAAQNAQAQAWLERQNQNQGGQGWQGY